MEKIATDSSFERVKYQWTATFLANLITLGQGCAIGWLSPSLPLLYSADLSPLLDGEITKSQAGWIGSLVSIGGIGGTFFIGLLTQLIGTKRALLLCAGPLLISWALVYLSQLVWHLYVARICAGITCGGVFICNSLFVAEIASDSVRGRLAALLQVCFNTGIMLGMVGGSFLDFRVVPMVMAVLPVAFICLFALIPNTPQYLLRCSRVAEAEYSLRFYRNCRDPSKEQEEHLVREFEHMQSVAMQNSTADVVLSDFLTKDAIRGLIIGPTLMAVSQFSGTFTLSNYASTIFLATGSTFDPNLSAIVVGCLQIVGTCCASMLMDRWGRKRLLLLSTTGCSVLLTVTGTFVYVSKHAERFGVVLADEWSVLPVCTLSLFTFIAAIGIIPVPYVMVAEILPQKIRKIGATICTTSVSVFSFAILNCFPKMLESFQLHGCMAIFAAVSVFGVLFTVFVVRETSGQNLDELNKDERPEESTHV